jgi:catechol 2,3-dioxygenase-like lactoylglutathione lyase family enzyme
MPRVTRTRDPTWDRRREGECAVALRTRQKWWGVSLDAPDAPALAHFYARLLGWQVFDEGEDGASVAPSEDAGYNLGFQTEENYVRPVWPSRPGEPLMMMHLDIEVDDLQEAVAHAVECGAELASYQPQDDVRVMLDPAGHPFCLYL